MNEKETYTLDEAHLNFAKKFNGRTWQLLGKSERTPQEDEEMEMAAMASLYHWLHAGTEIHRQRGEWLLAHTYTVLGESELAKRHAERCLDLTEKFKGQMEDFDFAYALEGMARASALCGDVEAAKDFLAQAREAGEKILDPENKEIFMGDLGGGDWHDIKV